MQALTNWPFEARRGIAGVLTDIDDTLTTAGAITADALAALKVLKAAGRSAGAGLSRWTGRSMPSSPKTAQSLFF